MFSRAHFQINSYARIVLISKSYILLFSLKMIYLFSYLNRYEREEVFLGLNLPVKSGNLQESLLQFVKDELLDGDNCYFCEKCNEKVNKKLT